jgi:pimeloyl-ACP methyl ester carboxylesterase
VSDRTLHAPDLAETYDDVGSGTPVLALHTSASTRRQWRGLAGHLAERCRVLTADLAGYGGRPLPTEGDAFRLEHEVAHLDVVLAHAGIDGPVHLVGHSYGGAVATAVALAHPERVASLTVYEPVLFHLLREVGDPGWDEVQQVPATVRRHLDAGDPEAAACHFVDYWTGAGSFDAAPARTRAAMAAVAPKVVLDFTALFAADWPPVRVGLLPAPVHVLAGTAGPQPARTVARVVASVADVEVTTFVGLGHMGPVTDPGLVDAALVDHLHALGAW